MIPIDIDCMPQVHVAAYHFEHTGYNNNTPGVGVLCALPHDVSVVAGGYHNSVEQWSNYGGMAWQPVHINSVRIGGMAGFVTGYGGRGETLPMMAAVISVPMGKHLTWHTTIVPRAYETSPAAAGFSFTWKL